MAAIERDFGNLHYRVNGRGDQAVVLLHEYFGTGESWTATRTFLARYVNVITPDLRGHGRSPMTCGRITVTGIAADVLALLDALSIESAHLVGTSLGAIVALHLGRTRPTRVRSLVASSVPVIGDPAVVAYGRSYVDSIFPRVERGLDGPHGDRKPGYSRNILLRNFEQDLEEVPVDHLNATEKCGEISIPTTIVAGDRDPVMSRENAFRLADRIPEANLAIIPSAGHLVHQEMPGIFNEILLDHVIRSSASTEDPVD